MLGINARELQIWAINFKHKAIVWLKLQILGLGKERAKTVHREQSSNED